MLLTYLHTNTYLWHSPTYIDSYLGSAKREYESLQDKGYHSLCRWNLDNSIVVHPQLS